MDTLPLAEAIAIADSRGILATVMVTQRRRRIEFSVALTSSDPEPTLSIRRASTGSRASDMLLGERQQFGPESWDYPAAITRLDLQYVIRLSARSGAAVYVPLLGADTLVLASGSWPSGDYVAAGVAASTFMHAMEELAGTAGTDDAGARV